jgi:AcrR family transcriptional regulator
MMTTLPNCPVSGKKSFINETEANQFEERNRDRFNTLRQYPYACLNCNSWHLSATPPGNNTIAKVRLPVVQESLSSNTGPKGISAEHVLTMKREGVSVTDIAKHFNVSEPTIYYHLKKDTSVVSTRSFKQAVTLNQVSQEEIELQKKLDDIRRVKERLLESTRMKVDFIDGHVVIKKNNEQITLPLSDVNQLFQTVQKESAAAAAATASPLPVESAKPLKPIWAGLPDIAGPEEQNLRILTIKGTWVATGYNRVVSLGAKKMLECSPDQIQRHLFSSYPQQNDPSGAYEAWVAPCGMYCRVYRKTTVKAKAGMWYLPLCYVNVPLREITAKKVA